MKRSSPAIYRPTHAEISLQNLADNALWLKSLSPRFFCPMVKANAYGHGDLRVARTLSKIGIKTMGVALIEEGVRLRSHGLRDETILVFGCFDERGAKAYIDNRLTPVVNQLAEIDYLKKYLPKDAEYPVHVKFNTGMVRLGFEVDQAEAAKKAIEADRKLKIVGVCSHLSLGEDLALENGQSQKQIDLMRGLRKVFGDEINYHLFNSAAGLSHWAHNSGAEMEFGFRPGISLYGAPPDIAIMTDAAREKWSKLPLKPVMSLKSGVINYHHLKKGESVSYGGIWTAPRNSLIGVVPIGYADGFKRHFSNKGKMLFRGKRVPVAGRVCMDYTMVDLTDVLGADFGDYAEEIVLIGDQGKESLRSEEIAAWCETISYEIFTGVSRRVPRKYID